jgi:ketosteroid isomerase-like protein
VREIAVRFADAYDARDVDAVVDLFAENGDWTLGPGTCAGKTAIRRVL